MPTQNRGDCQGTPNTQPGEEGWGGGTGLAVEEDRGLPVQCLHSHSHTNHTLDSLNNVDRSPREELGTAARTSVVGVDNPSGQDGWRSEDPPGDAVLLTPVPMGPQTPAPRGTQPPAENFPQQPDLARDLFELQHRRPGLKRRRSPQNNEQLEPELRSGLYGIGDGRERGKRPRIGIS